MPSSVASICGYELSIEICESHLFFLVRLWMHTTKSIARQLEAVHIHLHKIVDFRKSLNMYTLVFTNVNLSFIIYLVGTTHTKHGLHHMQVNMDNGNKLALELS